MWAQYADNNKGACIVINENKLIRQNESSLSGLFWEMENVSYKPYMSNEYPIETDVPELFVKENYKTIFFEKHIDWQQEDERRFLSVNGPNLLSINN